MQNWYEWASDGQTIGAKVFLSWDKKIKVRKIRLINQSIHNEHIMAGGIKFSVGTTIYLGVLPNAEYVGKEISFPTNENEMMEF